MKNIFIAIIFIVLILVVIFKVLNNVSIEFYSPRSVSNSIDESIKKKIFVKDVEANPNELNIGNEKIKFKQCWIEERTQVVFRFIFFKSIRKLDNFNFCFTLENKLSDNIDTRFRFIKDGAEYSFACKGGEIYYQQLDSLNFRNIKVFLLEGGKIIKYSKNLAEINFSF